MPAFALATLLPLAFLLAGAIWGGPWAWLGLLQMTVVTFLIDRLAARALPEAKGEEFPGSDALLVVLALGQGLLLVLVLRAAGDPARTGSLAPVVLGTALFAGQVGNSVAHELIHRSGRWLRRFGAALYVSILFGHHASAHVLVHHVRVATKSDPNSARAGEGLYRFMGRAWRGSFREGFRAERDRLARAGRPGWRHPYAAYVGGAAAMVALAALLGGGRGVLILLVLAGLAQAQLLMSDYVQHYGLTRAAGPDGRPVPVGPAHSWNSPHPASSALMLNAPRHSDHHQRPARPYPALSLPEAAPLWPRSLPVMACLALVPPLWRRVMDPRLPPPTGPSRTGM